MKDDCLYLGHIRDAIQRIQEYTREGKDAFFRDMKTQDAVLRNIEVIGEASKNMSERCKRKAPKIPWKEVAGMRDKVIHDYAGVRVDLVWEVVERELPKLLEVVKEMLEVKE